MRPPAAPAIKLGTVLPLTTQIIRFVISGGFAALIDFGLYQLLMYAGLPVAGAKSISFVAGTMTAYLINRRWTFQAPPSRARFMAVIVLYAVTFAVQVGINQILYQMLPHRWWHDAVAFVIAQGTATVINFVVQRTIIFRLSDRSDLATAAGYPTAAE